MQDETGHGTQSGLEMLVVAMPVCSAISVQSAEGPPSIERHPGMHSATLWAGRFLLRMLER
eukprot:5514072-Alexandrium_andersonii.AAC.1